MGIGGIVVVVFGLVAALQLSQMSQDQQTKASGERLCSAAGGFPEKANKGYTGYCFCPSGERVKPSGKCQTGPSLNPVMSPPPSAGGGPKQEPSNPSTQPVKPGFGTPITRPVPSPSPRPINVPGYGPTVKSTPTPVPSPTTVWLQ